jgi:lipid-A-disaccharide synthase
MKLFVSAGEASGDALGAALLTALARESTVTATGMGGSAMVETGTFQPVADADQVGVVGIAEVVKHLPRLFRLVDELAAHAAREKPDLAVLIDLPDFHLRLARKLKALGIPVVFYVAPSVWAWRPWRARAFAEVASKMLVLFPFEVAAWEAAKVAVEQVGHPLIDSISKPASESLVEPKTLGLMPGSRRSELERHWPVLVGVARRLLAEGRLDRVVVPVAPGVDRTRLLDGTEDMPIEFEAGDLNSRIAVLSRARLVVVASGTATLEVGLLGRPQIVVYRVAPLSHAIGRRLARVSHLGLVNLLADREVAPELIQADFTEERLYEAARRALEDGTGVTQALRVSDELRLRLGEGAAAQRAATAVRKLLK